MLCSKVAVPFLCLLCDIAEQPVIILQIDVNICQAQHVNFIQIGLNLSLKSDFVLPEGGARIVTEYLLADLFS